MDLGGRMRICSFIWGVGITRRAERVSLVDGLTTCMRWADASFLCGRLGLAGNAVASLCVCMRHVHGRVACFWVVYADVQFNCMCARASWLEIGESTRVLTGSRTGRSVVVRGPGFFPRSNVCS